MRRLRRLLPVNLVFPEQNEANKPVKINRVSHQHFVAGVFGAILKQRLNKESFQSHYENPELSTAGSVLLIACYNFFLFTLFLFFSLI